MGDSYRLGLPNSIYVEFLRLSAISVRLSTRLKAKFPQAGSFWQRHRILLLTS